MADDKRISPLQKAAMVISTLGTENASLVFKHFTDEEIEKLTLEVAKMDYYPMETVDEVLNDFYELCLTQKVISEGGVEYAKEVLEKAFGPQAASALFEKITKQLKTKAFSFVRKADYKNLLTMVQNEHPQTIALILSYARPEQASAILSELPKDTRIEVVERIAKMESASPDVVKSIEQTLERRFASLITTESTEVGGINYVADVLNNVDRATEKFIFDELNLRDPKLAESIRQKMFVFEDILTLDSMAIQAFIKEVDPKDLAVAIKGSSSEVAECIYANMSSRMRETTQTDVEYLHNVRMRDVEEAQQRIVAIIRRLEEEGVLVINKGIGDEVIA
jgi:flagellar motor switch protein FliG